MAENDLKTNELVLIGENNLIPPSTSPLVKSEETVCPVNVVHIRMNIPRENKAEMMLTGKTIHAGSIARINGIQAVTLGQKEARGAEVQGKVIQLRYKGRQDFQHLTLYDPIDNRVYACERRYATNFLPESIEQGIDFETLREQLEPVPMSEFNVAVYTTEGDNFSLSQVSTNEESVVSRIFRIIENPKQLKEAA